MKYYFFRDILNESNLENGKTYHAAGIVEKMYSELDNLSASGKDITVAFIDPFLCSVLYEWRSFKDVELFEVSSAEYDYLVSRYNRVDEMIDL